MADNSIFGKQQVLPGTSKLIRLGCIDLRVQRKKEGWILSAFSGDVEDVLNNNKPEQQDYFQTGKSNSLVILPALPSKPLVFKGSRINVIPKQKLTFFLKIPLSVQVYYSKNNAENLLKEYPCQRLSDTWFGEPDNGEPAFALGSEYFLEFRDPETSAFEAVCPVTIFNNSSQVLEVQRLIIRVEHLTLYLNAGRIVTSVVEIEYKGKETISSVDYRFSKTFNGEKQEIITKPKSELNKNLLKINFHFIKNMYKLE